MTAPGRLAAAEAFDSQGNVGKTSYLTLPFQSTVYAPNWGSSPKLTPAELFFQANPASFFNNSSSTAAARGAAAGLEAQNLIPSSGAQRWEDTYEASFPAGTFRGEPSWIQADRTAGNFPNLLDFVAWRNFITNNPQYQDVAFDGGTMPADPGYFRSWGGQYGHIDPATPLNTADCPPGMSTCTWGDSFAYRWGLTAALSGAYGIMLSDFTDSEPERTLLTHNFNQRIVTAFATWANYGTPGGLVPGYPSIPLQATYIVQFDFNRWVDFVATSYAKFYAALASRLGAATSRTGLVIDQCGDFTSYRRIVGIDQRIMAKTISPKQYLCIWDGQTIQVGRAGPIVNPIMQELAGSILGAAREPLLRNGANLEADDAAYWSAIATFYPTLSSADRTEVGYKLLKRLWVWEAFAHIADRSGLVRRALAFTSRDYWDAGSLTALNPLTSVIQSVVPSRPFGAAMYYSVPLERAVEYTQAAATGAGLYSPYLLYMKPVDLQTFLDGGTAVGYYVSDAALPQIATSAGNAPFAWMVIDPTNQLSTSERSALTAIAPVATSAAALAALPNQPLTFPTGLTGFGFYDQTGRLIIVVSNPSPAVGAGAISGNIVLAGTGLTDGSHKLTNLLTGATATVSFSNGAGWLWQQVQRWDTAVLAISP